jgi:glycosylphosphatidylinositol transamidase (GPIT) subunit GPI8
MTLMTLMTFFKEINKNRKIKIKDLLNDYKKAGQVIRSL